MSATTFLFTDIEGSTRLWEEFPAQMPAALAAHDQLLREIIEARGGLVFKTIGDGFCAAFAAAEDALAASQEMQSRLSILVGERRPLRVRIALHSGVAEERGGDYFGPPLNRVARLLAIGHGGQTLLSQATYALLSHTTGLRDLGMHRLRDLQEPEHVWQWGPQEFPKLRSLTLYDNNLPQQVTSFIGREKELSQVREYLQTARLLTVTGSGGCGKTRLTLQVATELLEQFSEGIWFVELASLTDAALVELTVADVLGVRPVPGESLSKTLVKSLKEKKLLVILDNCEHVLRAVADLVELLLQGCSQVQILVSSREALGILGEKTYRVPSLSVPESTQLLVERASSHLPRFALTESNLSTITQLCEHLDGIPLAIELAAARVRSMPVEQLASRLDDRFRLLTGGSRTALPRQQTLRALIDWSYELLNAQEKLLLGRLCVFSGGWALDMAEKVCGADGIEAWEVLDLLTALTDKSLVIYEEEEGGLGRYRLLETIRQYATEHLAASEELDRLRLRHRETVCLLAEEATTHLRSADQARWLQRFDQELENCRQAMGLPLPDPAHFGLRLALALNPYLVEMRGNLAEAILWLETKYPGAVAPPMNLAVQVLAYLGQAYWRRGDYAKARVHFEKALPLWKTLGDAPGFYRTLGGLANVIYYQGDYATAEPLYTEVLELSRQGGKPQDIARALNNSGLVAVGRGRHSEALALFEESLQLRRTLGDRLGQGTILGNLVDVYAELGRYDDAWQAAEESRIIGEEFSEPLMLGYAWLHIYRLARDEGDFARAEQAALKSLTLRHEVGERHGVLTSLAALMQLRIAEEKFVEATELLGATDTLRKEMDIQISPVMRDADARTRRTLREALPPEQFEHHYQHGSELPLSFWIKSVGTIST